MYEILSQHKEKGVLNISVKELTWRLYLDSNDNKVRYIDFNHLKKGVLDLATKELQMHSDIAFSYEVKKTGKKYTDLTFHITQLKSFKPSFLKGISTRRSTGDVEYKDHQNFQR